MCKYLLTLMVTRSMVVLFPLISWSPHLVVTLLSSTVLQHQQLSTCLSWQFASRDKTTSLQQTTGNMTDIHPCQVTYKRADTTAETFHLKWAPGDTWPWKTNQDCPSYISCANQTRISHNSGEILPKLVFFVLILFSSPEVTHGQKYPTYNQ